MNNPSALKRGVDEILQTINVAGRRIQVAELCAGDAPISFWLATNGLSLEQITPIDKFKTPTPLVEGLSWVYLDLKELALALINSEQIPEPVEKLRGRFDYVFLTLGFLGKEGLYSDMCAEYFCKPTTGVKYVHSG